MTSTLSSANIKKYEFLTGEDTLLEKDLLEKAVTIKIFEYSPLDRELKAQAGIAKIPCQKLGDSFTFDKIMKKEKPALESYSKSDLSVFTNIIVVVKNFIAFL